MEDFLLIQSRASGQKGRIDCGVWHVWNVYCYVHNSTVIIWGAKGSGFTSSLCLMAGHRLTGHFIAEATIVPVLFFSSHPQSWPFGLKRHLDGFFVFVFNTHNVADGSLCSPLCRWYMPEPRSPSPGPSTSPSSAAFAGYQTLSSLSSGHCGCSQPLPQF